MKLTKRFEKLDGYRLDGDISMPAIEWVYFCKRGSRRAEPGELNPKIEEALSSGVLK